MIKILGIDPGSLTTGYGLVEYHNFQIKLLGCGAIKVSGKENFPFRLKKIYEAINRVIFAYQPQILAIEDVFYAHNIQSVLKLGQVRGVILLAAAHSNLTVVEYSPRMIKQAVTGNGAASKEQVFRAVIHLLKMREPPATYDITDSLAVAICHGHRITSSSK